MVQVCLTLQLRIFAVLENFHLVSRHIFYAGSRMGWGRGLGIATKGKERW
jgi:hypothetical protein